MAGSLARQIEQTQHRVAGRWLASYRSSHHFEIAMTERAGMLADAHRSQSSPADCPHYLNVWVRYRRFQNS